MRQYGALHAEIFLSSRLREDERGKEERMAKTVKKEEERGEKRKREEEKEENETGAVKRRRDGSVSVVACKFFLSREEIWRVMRIFLGKIRWRNLSWSGCEPDSRARVRWVPYVTDVPVCPSSVVTELCDVSSCCSNWDFVEPQSFSFSKKRIGTTVQEEMRYEDSPVKAPPPSRRRMTPPTPLQNSYSSVEGEQGHYEEENQIWRAREKAPWRQKFVFCIE